MRSFLLALFLIAYSIGSAGISSAQPTHYHLLKSVPIRGEGGWDYLSIDAAHRHLFISHASQVEVYDLDKDEVVGHILHTEGVHGAAFAEPEKHGFITCGRSSSVIMFDLTTLDTIRRISVGEHPDGIIYEPATHHVFVINAKSQSLSVLDAKSGDVLTTIPLGSGPEFGVADGRGTIYNNLEDRSEVVKIDAKKNKILRTWSLKPGEGPTGIAIDASTNRLFIGCANQKMIVLNALNGNIVSVLPIGKGVDAVVFDPEKKLAFSSNGDGTMTVVREKGGNKMDIVQTVQTEPRARTIALDPKTHDVYLVTAQFGPTPEATKENPRPRPPVIPGTFHLLKYGE